MTLAEEMQEKEGHFEVDFQVIHHFGPGVYAKQMHIPAGFRAGQHQHPHAHLSLCVGGPFSLHTDTSVKHYPKGAHGILVPALTNHVIIAEGPLDVFCVNENPYDLTDPAKLDEVMIERN